MRTDTRSPNHLHYHDGTPCYGTPTLGECLDEAFKHCWLGKVLEKIDTVDGREVKCYSFIVSSFEHWAKRGKFVAETYIAARPIP